MFISSATEADGNGKMKDVLGGKGAGLAEMTNAACRCLRDSPFRPRPAANTCAATVSPEIDAQMDEALEEARSSCRDRSSATGENPLLVTVRSGAKFSMPGMMDTILNLGLNDKTVEALAKRSDNPRFAYDSYRRFIQMFGNVVLEIPKKQISSTSSTRKKKQKKAKLDTDLDRQGAAGSHRRVQEAGRRRPASRLPAGPAGAADHGARCRVPLLAERARQDTIAASTTSTTSGHRRQRAGHGVRQPGRNSAAPAWASRAIPPPARRSSTASS